VGLVGDILKSVIPTVHSLVDETTVTLYSGAGSEFDATDLDATTGSGATATVDCEAPWPYRAEGVGVESGLMRTSLDGQDSALAFDPAPGMLALLDGRTYSIVEAVHDLAGDDWLLTLKGAG